MSAEEQNLQVLEALKESGSGIYNSRDKEKYRGSFGEQGKGIKYIYVDSKGVEHTFNFTITVGENITPDSTIDFNSYGSGVYSDGKFLDAYNFTNLNDHITIRPAYGNDPYKYPYLGEAVDSLMTDLAKVYGLKDENSSVMGFSSTADNSVEMGAIRAMNGHQNVVVNCIEPPFGYPSLSKEQKQAMIDNNCTILNIHSTTRSFFNQGNYVKDYSGVHTIDVSFNITSENGGYVGDTHGVIYRYLVGNGLSDVNNSFDWENLPEIWTDPYDGKVYRFGYNATEYYIDEEGNYTSRKITDKSEISSLLFPEGSDPLRTDFTTLESSLNTFTNYVNASSFKESGSVSCGISSDTAVPVEEPSIVSSFLASITTLMGKISSEVSSIREAGDKIALMEKELETEALKLNLDITSKETDFVPLIEYSNEDDLSNLLDSLTVLNEDALSSLLSLDGDLPEDLLIKIKEYLDEENIDISNLKVPNEMVLTINDRDYTYDYICSHPAEIATLIRDKDMCTKIYDISAEELDKLFKHWSDEKGYDNSKLEGMGQTFIEAAKKTGLDPLTLVGICGLETGLGKDGDISTLLDNNNFLGLKSSDNISGSFNTPEDGIIEGASRIKDYYYDEKGFKSLSQLDAGSYDGDSYDGYSGECAKIVSDGLIYLGKTSPTTTVNPKLIEALNNVGSTESQNESKEFNGLLDGITSASFNREDVENYSGEEATVVNEESNNTNNSSGFDNRFLAGYKPGEGINESQSTQNNVETEDKPQVDIGDRGSHAFSGPNFESNSSSGNSRSEEATVIVEEENNSHNEIVSPGEEYSGEIATIIPDERDVNTNTPNKDEGIKIVFGENQDSVRGGENTQNTGYNLTEERKDPVVPPVQNEPVAPPVQNEPVAPPVQNEPVVPPVQNEPVVPPVQNEPVVPPVQNEPNIPNDNTSNNEEIILTPTIDSPIIAMTPTKPIENNTLNVIEEPLDIGKNIIDESVIEPEVITPEVETPNIIEINDNNKPEVITNNESNSGINDALKATALTAAIGGAIGAGVYAANQFINNKTPNDDHYEYEKDNNDKDGFVEYEDNGSNLYNNYGGEE